jgi:hypothetical protein
VPARFYLDNDVPRDVIDLLRAAGHDAVHCRSIFAVDPGDDRHLLEAKRQNRILVTHNGGDYILLHDAWRRWSQDWGVTAEHGGILVLPQSNAAEVFRLIDVFLSQNLPIRNELYGYRTRGGWVRRPDPSP